MKYKGLVNLVASRSKRAITQRSFAILIFLSCVAVSSAAPASSHSATAEILWDTWGVPHIYAQTDESTFRSFGYAQMQSHGDLLLRLMAQARGRGAEFYGDSYLEGDRAARIMGIYEIARRWHAQQSPEFRRYLDAFAEGINEYARRHPEKLSGAGKAVLPITGVDILAHTTRVLYSFLSAISGCSQALPEGVPLGSGDEWARTQRHPDGSQFGTNIWAIGPGHSASGHTMLLSNDHVPWGDATLFYEAQITAPGYSNYGTTMVGWPVLVSGVFNDYFGWTHSVNTIDACDMYSLTPDGDGYKFDGRKRSFETENQVIKIRQADGSLKEEPLVVRRAVQGPVVEKDGKFTAIRIAGLQASSFAGAMEEWWQMGKAHNLQEFQTALKRMQLPMFNVMYADRDGHILEHYLGLVPKRPKGDWAFWSDPVPGDTSSLVWNRTLSYDELPQVVDPPSGWVQSSNSAPWYMTEPFLDPAKFPPYLAPSPTTPGGAANLREERGLELITKDAKISLETLMADKVSTRSELADRVLPDLLSVARQSNDPDVKQAADVLEKWDREFNADSRGAELFIIWALEYTRQANIYAEPFDPKRPLDTPRGFRDPGKAAEALGGAARRLKQMSGRLDVPWGEINRLRRGKFDFPGNGATGDLLGVFRVIEYIPAKDGKFEPLSGDTFVAAVEFSRPVRAKVILTYGNSSNPDSPHFGDQLEMTSKKEWRDAWLTRAEVEKHLEGRTTFNNDGTITNESIK